MRPRGVQNLRVMTIAAGLVFVLLMTSVRAQWIGPAYGPPRRTRGTYGPGMSFGEFGYRMNYGYAFGNPYGGLGSLGDGFGYGLGPGYGPRGSVIYSSAYVTPGVASGFAGYYPPWAVYGNTSQNPAIFPAPAPNYGRGYPAPGPVRGVPRAPAGFVRAPR